jgi:hypothetical protein
VLPDQLSSRARRVPGTSLVNTTSLQCVQAQSDSDCNGDVFSDDESEGEDLPLDAEELDVAPAQLEVTGADSDSVVVQQEGTGKLPAQQDQQRAVVRAVLQEAGEDQGVRKIAHASSGNGGTIRSNSRAVMQFVDGGWKKHDSLADAAAAVGRTANYSNKISVSIRKGTGFAFGFQWMWA